MPLQGPNVHPKGGDFCGWCADENGILKSREEIRQGLVQWLSGIKPGEQGVDYLKRADSYMAAMPAWAD